MSYNSEIEKMIIDAGATGPRVTEDSIKAKIDSVLYMRPGAGDSLTVCKITMKNGFSFIGHSAAADPANYRQEIGDKIAYDNASRSIWSHEGYLLKEALHRDLYQQSSHEAFIAAARSAGHPDLQRDSGDETDTQAKLGQPAHE